MLKKLLKYDLEFMINKALVVFYGLAIIFALLTRLFFNIGDARIFDIIAKICSGTTITMMINIIINNVLRMWARFISNLYGDESYLTHTLPVKKSTHYASKILAAITSMLISFGVIILTAFIAYYTKERFDFLVNNFIYENGGILDVLLLVGVLVLQTIQIVQLGYTGVILGYGKTNLKLVWSFVYGGIAYIITQVCTLAIVGITALCNEDLKNMLFVAKENMEPMNDSIKQLMCVMFIAFIFYIAITWFINNKLFSKGVNVE
jgi:hypothetical protein